MGYDLNTKNKSFIKMRQYLQDNNIENNLFMLETKNKDLIGIDIIEKLNTLEGEELKKFRIDITEECKNNIWFYFREVLRLAKPLGFTMDDIKYENSIPFTLNPYFMAIIYAYEKGLNFFAQAPNGTEGSFILTCLYIYDRLILRSSITSDVNFLTLVNYVKNKQIDIKNILTTLMDVIPSTYQPTVSSYVSQNDESFFNSSKKRYFIDKLEFFERPLNILFNIKSNTQICATSEMNKNVSSEFVNYIDNRTIKFDVSLYDNKNIDMYNKCNQIIYIHFTRDELNMVLHFNINTEDDPNIESKRIKKNERVTN